MKPFLAMPLDHLVINTRFETDRAADLFRALGFTLTPQGRHPMGSVNHLMVFQDDYLELIGLPTDGGKLREEVLNSPVGIDGLVFRSDDADRVHALLTAAGASLQPLHAFSRAVELDGETFEARFRTVRFESDQFEAGRIYFCQHLTPELIWREPWQTHANTVSGLAGLLVVSQQPEADALRYASVAGAEVSALGKHGEWRIDGARYSIVVTTLDEYLRRYGDLACDALGRSSFFGAIALRVQDPEAIKNALVPVTEGVRHRQVEGRSVVALPGLNSLLDFIDGNDSY
ncbi:VOC family protein [Candidimonas sp. SYP-B2681]|uniref:VOC family protein n=1 Tax=Candidimonas sp. SYP-B2681 TaxID=2497686 RepID=UPI000F87E0F3|nr:VOC family protein [Candidimonas sp. SYP-B2681]RTZ45398.1 VOC family protein [Candidimonas sp. SYP-B2681]